MHRLTVAQVRRHFAAGKPVILPIGSLEQHGEHLPLGCDTFTAIGVAEEAADRADALVAPPVWYGWSPHHMPHPGTVSLEPETVAALVLDIGRSLAEHGCRSLVVVNGHRFSNVPPLAIAATRLLEEHDLLTVVADLAYLGADVYPEWTAIEESGGFSHGDAYETAHLLHLKPDLVDEAKLPGSDPSVGGEAEFEAYDPWNPSRRAAFWPVSRKDVADRPTGGNPAWATPERGEQIQRALVDDLVDLVAEVRERAEAT